MRNSDQVLLGFLLENARPLDDGENTLRRVNNNHRRPISAGVYFGEYVHTTTKSSLSSALEKQKVDTEGYSFQDSRERIKVYAVTCGEAERLSQCPIVDE